MIADVVVDLQYGDCGKGKIAHALCKENEYTHVIRYNGGCNAGHTIYHHGKKFVTHQKVSFQEEWEIVTVLLDSEKNGKKTNPQVKLARVNIK